MSNVQCHMSNAECSLYPSNVHETMFSCWQVQDMVNKIDDGSGVLDFEDFLLVMILDPVITILFVQMFQLSLPPSLTPLWSIRNLTIKGILTQLRSPNCQQIADVQMFVKKTESTISNQKATKTRQVCLSHNQSKFGFASVFVKLNQNDEY